MEWPDQSYETLRAAKLVHDFPEPIMADGVKGLGQVNKGGVENDNLLLTLLLQLPWSKYYFHSSIALSKTKLTP